MPMFLRSKVILSFCATVVVGLILTTTYSVVAGPRFIASSEVKEKLENTVYLQLKDGIVVIEMLPEAAPVHVARIKELCRTKFYDNLPFHRVIENFMAQTGDPKGNGTGGSGRNLTAEFSQYHHKRGAVSMARAADHDSADSQFFIVTHDSGFLDGQYTLWGYVVKGMEYVDKIKKGDSKNNGIVVNPDKIITMRLAIDVEKEVAVQSPLRTNKR